MCKHEIENVVEAGRVVVVMALHEDHDTQAKRYWQNRLARERLNISESVEETLADTSSQEQWFDDEQKHASIEDSSPSNAELVPPRLSLQSKVLPSVRPASFVQSVTAELAAQKIAAQEKEEHQKPQSTNILTRFAQRFTASLAAFGAAMQPDTPAWAPTRSENDDAQPQERYLSTVSPAYAIAPIESVQSHPATVIDAIPATPSITSPQPVKSKQRLAGHTAKVHLQMTPTSSAAPEPEEKDIYGWSRESKKPLREPLTVNVRLRESIQDAPRPDLPRVTTSHAGMPTQQEKRVEKGGILSPETSCTSFFGTGAFESGQSELMVRNTHIVASGVVHITLTSNPGPTLVQYISLHPTVGFTLHLTAPVAAKTTFNYVVFVDSSMASL